MAHSLANIVNFHSGIKYYTNEPALSFSFVKFFTISGVVGRVCGRYLGDLAQLGLNFS